MEKSLCTPSYSLYYGQCKDSDVEAQMKREFEAFQCKSSTMQMAFIETRICPNSSTVQRFTPPTPIYSRLLLNLQRLLSYEN